MKLIALSEYINDNESYAHGSKTYYPETTIRHGLDRVHEFFHLIRECEIRDSLYHKYQPKQTEEQFHVITPPLIYRNNTGKSQ